MEIRAQGFIQQTLPLAPAWSPSSKYPVSKYAEWNGTGPEQDCHGYPLATEFVLRPCTYQAFPRDPRETLFVACWNIFAFRELLFQFLSSSEHMPVMWKGSPVLRSRLPLLLALLRPTLILPSCLGSQVPPLLTPKCWDPEPPHQRLGCSFGSLYPFSASFVQSIHSMLLWMALCRELSTEG